MSNRALYIAAYDVSDPTRLRHVHKIVKGYATGGQKSVFECFVTPPERQVLFESVKAAMDPAEDRFALLRVEERTRSILRGIAVPALDPDFYYVG